MKRTNQPARDLLRESLVRLRRSSDFRRAYPELARDLDDAFALEKRTRRLRRPPVELNPILTGLTAAQRQRFEWMKDDFIAQLDRQKDLTAEQYVARCEDPVVRERFLEDDLVGDLICEFSMAVRDDENVGTLESWLAKCPNERS